MNKYQVNINVSVDTKITKHVFCSDLSGIKCTNTQNNFTRK